MMSSRVNISPTAYEARYKKFVELWNRGLSKKEIANELHIGVHIVGGENYQKRLETANGMYELRESKVDNLKVDRTKMMDLVHKLEHRYHIGEFTKDQYGRGYTIRFDDATIPNDDPDYIELQQVVHAKH